MPRNFAVGKSMLEQIAQSLLEMKKMGRSLENGAEALLPLTDDEDIKQMLHQLSESGKQAAEQAARLYGLIAREALRNDSQG